MAKAKPKVEPQVDPVDPLKHRRLSFAKSFLRGIGCLALIAGALPVAGGFLLVAEVVGVFEELV